MRLYFRGIPVAANDDWWLFVLEAAGNDPLRAQEIEGNVNAIWWQRWLAYRRENTAAIKQQNKAAQRRSRRR
jgi:hypothetical protein